MQQNICLQGYYTFFLVCVFPSVVCEKKKKHIRIDSLDTEQTPPNMQAGSGFIMLNRKQIWESITFTLVFP